MKYNPILQLSRRQLNNIMISNTKKCCCVTNLSQRLFELFRIVS